jgi:hypothetical protein
VERGRWRHDDRTVTHPPADPPSENHMKGDGA